MTIPFKDFIKKHTGHIDFSKDEWKQIPHKVRHYIFSKNKENIEFMTSPLIGIHRISFTDSDVSTIFKMYGIDLPDFIRDIPRIKDINPDWKVSTIPFNILSVILMHKVILEADSNEDMLIDIFLIMSFKIFTSAYSKYFQYPIDEKLARTIYDRLSKKFILKKEGNNYKVFLHKSQYVLKGTTIWKRLKTTDIEEYILAMNAISGYIRQYLHSFFLQVLAFLEKGDPKTSTVSILDEEGEVVDIENNNKIYYDNIEKILLDRTILINRDVIDLIFDVLNINIKNFDTVLLALHKRMKKEPNTILNIIDNIVKAILYYLYQNDFYPPYDQNIGTLIMYLKAYVSNSKVKNPALLKAKELIQNVIIKDVGIHRHQTVVHSSIIVIIYLFLMASLLSKPK